MVLRDVVHADKSTEKGYAKFVGALKRHFQHQIVIAERFKFHRSNQKKEESVKEFITALRRLSEQFQFCAFL